MEQHGTTFNDILELLTDDQKIGWAKRSYANLNLGRSGKLKQSMAARRFYEGDHAGYANFLMSAPNPTFVNKYGRRVPYPETLIENKRTMILQSHPHPTIGKKLNAKNIKNAEVISLVTQRLLDDIWDAEELDSLLEDFVLDALIDGLSFLQLYTDYDGIHVTAKKFEEVLLPMNIFEIDKASTIGIKFSDVIGKYRDHPDYKNVTQLKSTAVGREWDFIDMFAHETDMKFPTASFEVRDMNDFDAVEWQTLYTLTKQGINKLKRKYKWVEGKKPGDKILWILTVSNDTIIRDQFLNIDSYYIYPYCPLGGNYYRPSLFSRLISMGKAYDVLWTTLEEYAAFAIKYRILSPRDSIVTPITNQNGTIIRYTGEPPTEMGHSDVSAGYFDMLSKYEAILQTLVNVSPSSMGEMASGSKKFKAMESQKMQDLSNTKPSIMHLKTTLKHVVEGILNLIDENYDIRDVVYDDKAGIHPIKVVGNKYAQNHSLEIKSYNHTDKEDEDSLNDYFTSSSKDTGLPGKDLVIVHKEYPVEISITQGLDYGEQGIQNDLLELAKTLPQDSPMQKAFIKAWAASKDVGEIQKYLDEAEREMEEDEAQGIQRPSGQEKVAGQVPPHVHLSPQDLSGLNPVLNPSNLNGGGVPGNPQAQPAGVPSAVPVAPQAQGGGYTAPNILPGMIGAA